MAEGYQVVTTELHNHVAAVRRVADTLGQAMDAAQSVTMGVQAYGMICGPLFVPIVMAVSAPGLITLKIAQESIGKLADEVKATAEHYDTIDQATARAFAGIEERLS
ncbi:type VII secretion target [Lentzea sp. NBRC 105346]|uniref:type VII secretion target n=1 Tax=Lentzea sp. NBRC 105346 TaxID=3032205 RepID=UPI002553F254|nr:type VII secretion target [Lentzea sp. NBRC 105346]